MGGDSQRFLLGPDLGNPRKEIGTAHAANHMEATDRGKCPKWTGKLLVSWLNTLALLNYGLPVSIDQMDKTLPQKETKHDRTIMLPGHPWYYFGHLP
jgi:hypothetical protein